MEVSRILCGGLPLTRVLTTFLKEQGLFQVSVKLPHAPYKIQVTVGP